MNRRAQELATLIGMQLTAELSEDCRTALVAQLAERVARSKDPRAMLDQVYTELGVAVVDALAVAR